MLRPRPALAALATVLAVAVGSTAAVLTTHRPTTATGGTVVTTQPPDTTAPPATTTSPSTGPTAHRPTQTAPQPPTTSPPISDPAQAARQLFQAWQAGDQPRARQAATPSAVSTLFAFTPTPKLRFTSCRFSSHGYDCFYTSTDVGLWYLDLRVGGGAPAGYRVVSVNARRRSHSGRPASPDMRAPQPRRPSRSGSAGLGQTILAEWSTGLVLAARDYSWANWIATACQPRSAPPLTRRVNPRPTVV
jgi:hypothetical protein